MTKKKRERRMIIYTIVYIILLVLLSEILNRSGINLRYIKLPYRISTGLWYLIWIIIWFLSMALFEYLGKSTTKREINKSVKRAIKLSNQWKYIESNEILEEVLNEALIKEGSEWMLRKDSIYLHMGHNYFSFKDYKSALHYFELGKKINPNNKLILEYITKISELKRTKTHSSKEEM